MGRGGRKVVGTCHICGEYGPLTFEHVPPEAAFNDRSAVLARQQDILRHIASDAGLEGAVKGGRIQQRGAGAHTLCDSCNNNTGHWYGNQFADWCFQGMRIMLNSGGDPRLVYPIHTFPLEVLKQVATMFFSVNSDGFQAPNQELVKFVLDPGARFLSPRYRFFAYFNANWNRMRYFGLSGIVHIDTGSTTMASEISFPPFGYVMAMDYQGDKPNAGLCEITHFAWARVKSWGDVTLPLRALETNSHMPIDYRTKKEIQETIDANKQWIREHPNGR